MPTRLQIVPEVSIEHGRRFADAWMGGGTIDDVSDSFEAAAVMTWPESDRDAQDRCIKLQDEILERLWSADVREAIAASFVRAADEVLAAARKSEDSIMPEPKHAPLDEYFITRPHLVHIRIMDRFFDAVDDNPEWRKFKADLHCAYMDILNEELAPQALTFALAVAELEERFPEIRKTEGADAHAE